MFFDIEKSLRKLAKQAKWQVVYSASKETNIGLFHNQSDYSYSQILFLNYLAFYSSLNIDIFMKEVSEIVLKDFIYEDAYQLYKSRKEKLPVLQTPQENLESKPQGTSWVFKRPSKKQ